MLSLLLSLRSISYRYMSLAIFLSLSASYVCASAVHDEAQPQKKTVVQTTPLTFEDVATALSSKIGYAFKNPANLELALRQSKTDIGHSTSSRGYERLEFLGDAILEYTLREALFWQRLDLNYTDFVKICSDAANNETLAKLSLNLALAAASKSLQLTKRDIKNLEDHDHADFVEALIAALYIDGGIQASQAFIKRYWMSEHEPLTLHKEFSPAAETLAEFDQLGHSFKNGLSFRLLHSAKDLPKILDHVGDGIIRFVLRDFLCKRFPDLHEAELVRKYDGLMSKETLEDLKAAYNLKADIRSVVSALYIDGGFQAAERFILWHWTAPSKLEKLVPILARDKDSPESTFSQKYPLTLKLPLQNFKNLIAEVVSTVDDTVVYETEKTGPDNSPLFKTKINSQKGTFMPIILDTAERSKLAAELEAARQCFQMLSCQLLATIIDASVQKPIPAFALKILEAQLYLLTGEKYTYHLIATKNVKERQLYRLELQGRNLYPTIAEGDGLESTQQKAAANAIYRLLIKEAEKISQSEENPALPINDKYLELLKAFYEYRLKEKGNQEIRYDPVSKNETTNKSKPLLTYRVTTNNNINKTGKGFTPLQAQIKALEKIFGVQKTKN